jgi:FkbM family methyltransferase
MTLICRNLGDVHCGTRGDDYLEVSLQDCDGRSAYFFGCNDKKVSAVIGRVLKNSDHAADIGANYGAFTLLMARCVGAGGSVHCFEPQPRLNAALRSSIVANGFRHIVQHEVALSDHNGEEALYTLPGVSGAAALGWSGPLGRREPIKIPVRSANEELARVGRCKLLKIDVEGHEVVILKAAERYLRTAPPDYLLFESNEPKEQFYNAALPVFLRSLGYSRIYEISHSLLRCRLRLVAETRKVDPRAANFLAVFNGVAASEIQGCVTE